ncbi:hypothetical protein MLD38_035730 [Melastoma candidum]|uniref:Uncharacterized protein n=1 Tax=Melastoma candidum TaxID=119954 RepID=A0ACB9LH12_9MYRT|nr:hypothetical protein MLD38_035730 [Melastoma candidum]
MAMSGKFGSILRKTILQERPPSLLQSIRCLSSSSKLFVGGAGRVIADRDSGRSRGFGFVSFSTSESASSALSSMDGQELQGRNIRVSFANERPPRSNFGGGYGGGFGGGRGADDAY